MEQTANTFTGGLIKDLNPIATPNDVLTDALNATLITFNGNETMLQNDMGNTNLTYYPKTWEAIESENDTATDYREVVSKIREKVKLKDGYIPIGMKEHGDIIYIVSYNPEENRTEIGSFPGPEYRPIDKVPSKEINKDVIIKEDTLSKIYNLTEEGETLLKPYDLISDYSMEGLSPMFISTPTNKGLYIPKYINVNTNQDITDTINITYTYKTKHRWYDSYELIIYNYKISKELFNYINGTLNYYYDYELDLNNLKNTSILLKPKIHLYQIETELSDKIITETITEEYYPIFTEYTYKDEDFILLLTYYDLFNDSNLELYMSNCIKNNLELLTNDNDSFNPFIFYPNIKKGDIGVSYTIEDIEGIMYTNKKTEEFNYKTYIPEVSYVDDLVYENVVIQNSSFEDYTKLYYKSNLFGGAIYNKTSLKLNDDFSINIKQGLTLKTQGYYLYNYIIDASGQNNITYEMLLFNYNDYIYLTVDEYNVLDDKYKTEWHNGSNNYEIIEKVITLNINGINVKVPALLYRKIENNNLQPEVYIPTTGIVIPPGITFDEITLDSLVYFKEYQKKQFKILALGIIDEIKCKDRKITFLNIEVRDDNSMVKVNNIDFKCYYNNKEIYNNTFQRDYNTNIIEINDENGYDLSIPLNNENDSEYKVLLLRKTYDGKYYLLNESIIITNSFNEGELTYEITPNNTDFEIDLSKHKIVKTLNLLKSKDSLLGNSDWVDVQDTYNQSYENCSIIEDWINNPSALINKEVIKGTKKLTVNYGVSNLDYRYISLFRDVKNANTTTYNGYFYSNNNNNSYNVSIKPIDESELYNKPNNTSEELFKNLKIHLLKLNINPITYRIFLDGKKREGHGETYKETELVKIKTTYNVYNSETKKYDDTFEDIQTVPSSKMQAVTTHNAYHCYGLTEYTTIPKGIKDISKESIINTKEPILLLNISSKLLDKAKRDDEVFAIALRKSTCDKDGKDTNQTYDITLGIDKENIKSFITYTPHNVLKTTKDSIGSYSYYIITDTNTGFTYYYLNDSDGKIVLKNEEELKSTKLNSNTNTSNWLIDYNGVTCNNVEYDQYTTFKKSDVNYYNCLKYSTITIDDTIVDKPKIIAFYVKSEDVDFVQCDNLIQPKDFNGNIDAEDRDEIGALESSIYRKTRSNQSNYYRIVLLKNKNGQDTDGNNIISKIQFLKDMTIYNPIIYDAAIINGEDDKGVQYSLCYDFRAPAMKLNYLEYHPKEIIEGHSLDKTYLPKPFYEIIN